MSASELATVNVVAVTSQPGAELPENLLPYNVQSASREDFARAQALDVTDYLNRSTAGVTINSAQGNPLQPDVQFRGFTATPLLGGAQGISVYVDGVRVNEVFGDTINWDLIPEEAMSRMTLLSGANPVFGLNTLGGAIQIQTKNGFSDPDIELESYAGSFGRVENTVQGGGNDGTWGYYLLANHFHEDGWRDLSNSKAGTALATLSWHGDRATLDLHLSHSQTQLTGNGPQAIQLLQLAPRSVFTAPDITKNNFSGATVQGTFKLYDDTLLTATLFGRRVNTLSYNGDVTDFDSCDDDQSFLCNDDGSPVLDQKGSRLSSDYTAINNIGVRQQLSYGGSLQAVFKQPLFGLHNQFVAGIEVDHGRVDYASILEAAVLTPNAGDPYSLQTSSNSGITVPDAALSVHIDDVTAGAYFSDTLSATEQLAITVSGRSNHSHIAIDDPTAVHPDLEGDHRYQRFNPAAGITYQWSPAVNFYSGYSQSTRAPTPVELTCADPNAPCLLPNDFISDPNLKQVVAKSWEAGLRGHLSGNGWLGDTSWRFGLYRTTNINDILFQTTGGAQSNQGFYANVGDTRRQGIQAALSGRILDGRLDWFANYSYLDATFVTPFLEVSANNPQADPETAVIQVEKGDRIPSLPKNAFKFGADLALTRDVSLGANVIVNSSQYLRGDEANLERPLGGFAVVNAHATYRVNEHVRFFARVDNVFNRDYSNFGILGNATDIYPGFTYGRFASPAAPRAGWFGVTLER